MKMFYSKFVSSSQFVGYGWFRRVLLVEFEGFVGCVLKVFPWLPLRVGVLLVVVADIGCFVFDFLFNMSVVDDLEDFLLFMCFILVVVLDHDGGAGWWDLVGEWVIGGCVEFLGVENWCKSY